MSYRTVALERLRSLFFEHFHVEVPSPDTDLLESGLLDSLQLVDLLLLIEEEFGRRISLEAIELDDLRTLSRLTHLVGTSPELSLDARSVSTHEQRSKDARGSDARAELPEPVARRGAG
ncbi:MAG TPA: phosphopantetheine-binding protein [Steroidobacteraceae bacterium]|nr:phosphopantetheine-binding protein [Steroidobacteraceae bacterium]